MPDSAHTNTLLSKAFEAMPVPIIVVKPSHSLKAQKVPIPQLCIRVIFTYCIMLTLWLIAHMNKHVSM